MRFHYTMLAVIAPAFCAASANYDGDLRTHNPGDGAAQLRQLGSNGRKLYRLPTPGPRGSKTGGQLTESQISQMLPPLPMSRLESIYGGELETPELRLGSTSKMSREEAQRLLNQEKLQKEE